jgi:FHS family L-fucose permease-like MFS transporter
MIDIMDKHFQDKLHLSLAQSAWVQFAHYLGYLLMALPAGALAKRLGYKGGIIAGLLLVAVGGLWFLPATRIAMFWAFLLGVCIIASGLASLETVANPYVSILGNPRYAATRINLAQSCNGIGWILGPIAGSVFFYAEDAHGNTAQETLYIPYVGVAVVVLILAAVFLVSTVPDIQNEERYPLEASRGDDSHGLWRHPHFVFAVVAQFLYVAAQAGIFSFFINYMTSQVPAIPETWNSALSRVAHHAGMLQVWLSGWFAIDGAGVLAISNKGAANLASLAFVFFLAGRFIGAGILRTVPGHRLLAAFGAANVIACLLVLAKFGWLSVACVFASYLFMSIMFPTIFALGIYGLGAHTKRASAYLVMAIIGGALLPKLMGYVADQSDMSRAFVVPMVCFVFIAYYGYRWPAYSKAAG